ncbi:hypothetical protein ACNOYE_16960 [Nannocystaceae bacterium ST9]
MHRLEVSAWTARLHHLLVVERYGFSRVRFPGGIPAAARSRTARHLALRGAATIDALAEAWPEVTTLPVWSDLRRALIEQTDLGPMPAPMARRGYRESPLLRGDDPLTRLRQLLHRLAYLHDEEELHEGAFGLLTISDAWRASLQDVVNPLGNLLEIYLGNPSTTQRLLVRFALRNRRVIDEWRTIDDRELFARFAAAVERQPDSLAAAPAEQIERLRLAGALAAGFTVERPVPEADLELDRPFPLARVPSGHFDLHPLQEPALVTMSPLLEQSAMQ